MQETIKVASRGSACPSNADCIISCLGLFLCTSAENPRSGFHPVVGGRDETDWWRRADGLLPVDGEGWREYCLSALSHSISVNSGNSWPYAVPDRVPGPPYLLYWQLHQSALHRLVPLDWQLMPGDWRVWATLCERQNNLLHRSVKGKCFPRNPLCLKSFWFVYWLRKKMCFSSLLHLFCQSLF